MLTVEYFGVTGTGKTVREAKLDAGRKIEKCFSDGITPILVRHEKYPVMGLIYQYRPGNWGYSIIHGSQTFCGHPISAVCCNEDQAGAISRCRAHLAQWAFHPADPEQTGLEFLTDPASRKNHIRWIAWQRDYRRLIMAGNDDRFAHANAQHNMELVQDLAA